VTISIHRLASLPDLAEATTNALAAVLSAVLADQHGAALAVPGGSTARLVLPALAARPLPWQRIRVTLVDERWVPADHPDSNERLVRTGLEAAIGAGARLIGLNSGADTPEQAVADLTSRVPRPDVVLLGMGEDGHIASIFPSDAANTSTAVFAAVQRPDHARITLTPAAIVAATHVTLAFAGTEKQTIFERALAAGPTADIPVRHALRSNTEVFIGP